MKNICDMRRNIDSVKKTQREEKRRMKNLGGYTENAEISLTNRIQAKISGVKGKAEEMDNSSKENFKSIRIQG